MTRQPVLRRFFYPVLPADDLADSPVPFVLLGQKVVLWRDGDGVARAAEDRCCHRTAMLSKGWVDGGELVCGYHGWAYDGAGKCTRIPQWKNQDREIRFSIRAFATRERYGFVWVCLDAAPLADIPDFPEEDDPAFRRIPQFYETWDCAGLRIMENSFDNAHFSFVHRNTFGDQGHPEPASIDIEETAEGFVMRSDAPVVNPDAQKKILRMDSDRTVRHMTATWYMPFARKLHIRYPNGLIHAIVTIATPIDDRRSQICQFVMRNDTEADAKAEDIIAFDRAVTAEDKDILEATEADVPLDIRSGDEFHMPSDRPGLLMRKRLLQLLAEAGESEATDQPGRAGGGPDGAPESAPGSAPGGAPGSASAAE
ncbi:MAG: aromatic ring-hydroxylating dioxygenase subunit alpha [Azospirillaceae bacterium]